VSILEVPLPVAALGLSVFRFRSMEHVALTVEPTKKLAHVVVAAVLLVLAAGVLVVGHPWSDVGRSGIVSVTLSCAR
jgi:hypothetical protein